jgi:hypothetical protein
MLAAPAPAAFYRNYWDLTVGNKARIALLLRNVKALSKNIVVAASKFE